MSKSPGQQGNPSSSRPGKPNQTNNPKGPDKLSGGGMPPNANPKGGK